MKNDTTQLIQSSVRSRLTLSHWPDITYSAGLEDWDRPGEFTFELPVSVTVQARGVGIHDSVNFYLLRTNGVVMDTANNVWLSLDPGQNVTFEELLHLQDSLEWEVSGCATPVPLGTMLKTEALRVEIRAVTDNNGYTFLSGTLPPERNLNTDVGVPQYKIVLYEFAYADYVLGGAESIMGGANAAAAFFGCVPCAAYAVIEFAAQTLDLALWATHCDEARDDPPGYDMQYNVKVAVSVPQINAASVCGQEEEAQLSLGAAEQGNRISARRSAYNQTYNKLFGAYLDGNLNGILMQAAELLRHGAVVDRELSTYAANRLAAQAAMGVPSEAEVVAFQQEVQQNGFPAREIEYFGELGWTQPQIDSLEADVVAADPDTLTAGAPTDLDTILRPVPDFYWNHSYTVVPSGYVITAVTRPMHNERVQGTITVDARAVKKIGESLWCGCGPALVTEVKIDGQMPPFNSVPYPAAPWCPPPAQPYPQAVPATLNTATLTDGAHTIQVTARDSQNCATQVDPREHVNNDMITIYVDNTSPILTVTVADADPVNPGVQVTAGSDITYTAQDPVVNGYSSGVVDAMEGLVPTVTGVTDQVTLCISDRAGGTDTQTIQVAACIACDCNNNGTRDYIEILAGTANDCNSNSVPDECETLPTGDFDGDLDVDLVDYVRFTACLTGPCPAPPCVPSLYEGCCSVVDSDTDGDVDLRDFTTFQDVFSGPFLCGNGVIEGREQCDDGGESASCDANCTAAICGDGTLNVTAGEQCDDGNNNGGDGCSATCTIEPPPLPDCTIFFDAPPCPNVSPVCGASFSGGAGCMPGGSCALTPPGAYEVSPGPSLLITLSGDLNRLEVMFSGYSGSNGVMVFRDAYGVQVDGPLYTNGNCQFGPPLPQRVVFSRPVRMILVIASGGVVWIDVFHVNPP